MQSRIGALALLCALTVLVVPGAASAAPIGCGSVITQSTTLTSDVGPCNQGGLVIGADGVTLDLGGHTVKGKSRSGDGVGISTNGHSGVTITNGTVRDFDTGVQVQLGANNTVSHVTARDNIGTAKFNSKFGLGDGIAIDRSSSSSVRDNTVVHNGPFGGITILADTSTPASGNVIEGNLVVANDVAHDGVNEDDGIRIEGPNAPNNTVRTNTVRQSGLDGISLFADQGTGFPNSGNVVTGNTVEGNGFHDKGHRKGDGIVLFGSPTSTTVTGANSSQVSNNQVHGNAANGIRVASRDNLITSNDATGNAAFPGQVNVFDLRDQNPSCDNNTWTSNVFGTANLPCIN